MYRYFQASGFFAPTYRKQSMKLLAAIITILVLFSQIAVAQSDGDSSAILKHEQSLVDPQPRYNGFYGGVYTGVITGFPTLLGFNGRYVGTVDNSPAYYVDGDVSPIGFWAGFGLGAGLFLSTNAYIGVRGHYGSRFEEQFVCFNQGVSPEFGYIIPLTKSRDWILTVDGGPSIEWNSCPTEKTDRYRWSANLTVGVSIRIF